MNSNPLEALFGIFNKLSMQQKMLIGGAILLTIVMLGVLVFFLNEPNYSVLYSGLAEEDASKVVDELTAEKVPYKIEDNGRTIKVPKDKLYETRLSLAGKGIPGSGVIGYELFDKNTMGMSEFMQKLNYKRALEGELARTIMQQEGIEGVRVHIVIPQKSVFKSEEKPPTASVVLKLKHSYEPDKGTVTAIVNLVASSVEGLQPGKVTLLDSRGRLLSKDFEDNPVAFSSAKQYEMKQSVENYLAAKAQTILDNVVGYGNSMIQVNADINFDQIEKTMETFDPESQVAVSEQTIKSENNGNQRGDSTAQTNENSTTNYEISKSVEKVLQGSGNIIRLSVAAVVNDVAKEVNKGDKTDIVHKPRTADQMKKLEEIIKNAVGINPQRQDQFSLVNISFETNTLDDLPEEKPGILDYVERFQNIILIIIAAIAGIFILKGLMSKLKNEKILIGTINGDGTYALEAGAGSTGAKNPQQLQGKVKKSLMPLGDIEDEISEEAAYKKNREAKISNYVSKNPVDASKLINAWLHDDELS